MSCLLFELVAKELSGETGEPMEQVAEKLGWTPEPDMGDVAFPCFSLSKTYKKSPVNIAAEMAEKLIARNIILFSKIETVGGYINFHLNKEVIFKHFCEKIVQNSLVDLSAYKGKTVTIEHTSVNPNASPHIGRARNAMIGDAIVRLMKFIGCDVTVRYFVNDMGKQIALLACYTKDRQNITFSELLDLYVAANEELKTNTALEKDVFDMLYRMENGDKTVFDDFSRVVDICIKGQTAIFNEFGIYYDEFDYESQYVLNDRTNEVLDSLNNTGRLFEDEEGRMVLNLEEFNINSENPYLPLTRKDKTSLYPLRDICYNIFKSGRESSRNIVVLGEDQRLYGRQINAALELLGLKGAEIVNYSFVLLSDGKMSTRDGQVVLLESLMRETAVAAKAVISKQRDIGEKDDKIAKQLAYGAIKYSILKCNNDKNVIFSKDSALNFQGDTGVYIQYTYARIQSLLRGEDRDFKIETLPTPEHPLEWEIVKKILLFDRVILSIIEDFSFGSLCRYLYELCQIFSRWYGECTIKNIEGEVKRLRLFLATVISDIIRDGLYILGIDSPEHI